VNWMSGVAAQSSILALVSVVRERAMLVRRMAMLGKTKETLRALACFSQAARVRHARDCGGSHQPRDLFWLLPSGALRTL